MTTPKPPAPVDEDKSGGLRELGVMRTCARALDSLEPDGRARALTWLNGAYWVEPVDTYEERQ